MQFYWQPYSRTARNRGWDRRWRRRMQEGSWTSGSYGILPTGRYLARFRNMHACTHVGSFGRQARVWRVSILVPPTLKHVSLHSSYSLPYASAAAIRILPFEYRTSSPRDASRSYAYACACMRRVLEWAGSALGWIRPCPWPRKRVS